MRTLAGSPPRVSRETRLLVMTALAAIAVLWVLARLRLPDGGPRQTIPAPILAPFVAQPSFTTLAAQLAQLSARTAPSLVPLALTDAGAAAGRVHVPAIRLRDELGAALLTDDQTRTAGAGGTWIASDPATGLALVAVPPGPSAPPAPDRFMERPGPDYVMRAVAFAEGTVLSPVLVSRLVPMASPLWDGMVWVSAGADDLPAGSPLFSPDGEWVGVSTRHQGRPAVVPAAVFVRAAERLAARGARPQATIGVELQEIPPSLAQVSGGSAGAVVAWVEADGPADGVLQIGDVLRGAGGQALPSVEHWRRYLADVAPGPVPFQIRRDGRALDVTVPVEDARTAVPRRNGALPGLALRTAAGVGAAVTAVTPGSPGDLAGFHEGDVIVGIGALRAPTPAQLAARVRAYGASPVPLTVLRDGARRVLVFAR